jgi:hypothetical protein
VIYELVWLFFSTLLAGYTLYYEWLEPFAPSTDRVWEACLLSKWED